MLFQPELSLTDDERNDRAPGAAPLLANLPGEPVLTERAAAAMRGYLRARGLDDYRILHCTDLHFDGIEAHLDTLGEEAVWEPPGAFSEGGEYVAVLQLDRQTPRLREVGFLNLRCHQVVLARWYWTESHGSRTFRLCAAPTVDHVRRLHQDVKRCRTEAPPVWQIVRGDYGDGEPVPRGRADGDVDGLVLPAPLRQRIESEVIAFFGDAVARLYRSLDVPHRRGVLLHGPPGNGKTSIIRWIGAALPRVAGMILRPSATFDSDDLQQVIDRWKGQAPCILVIEDLNWLLKKIDVSLFLNLIDGVEPGTQQGLLLIGTTNHPHELDPAVNNRPGRFDVVIEIPCPDAASRTAFLGQRLPDVPEATRARLVGLSDGFSFAHLHELLRLSGLRAIHEGRDRRSDGDLFGAAGTLRAAIEEAERGFPSKLDLPFGLHHVRAARQGAAE